MGRFISTSREIDSKLLTVSSIFENSNIVNTAPPATVTFDSNSNSVAYFTSTATQNFAVNLRHSSTESFDSFVDSGVIYSFIIIVENGATAYYPSSFSIDGVSQTPVYSKGTDFATTTDANSTSIFGYTVLKTGSATYKVLASQSDFS